MKISGISLSRTGISTSGSLSGPAVPHLECLARLGHQKLAKNPLPQKLGEWYPHCGKGNTYSVAPTNDFGLMTRLAWTLMPSLLMCKDCQGMPVPAAKSIERRLMYIPNSPFWLGESKQYGKTKSLCRHRKSR